LGGPISDDTLTSSNTNISMGTIITLSHKSSVKPGLPNPFKTRVPIFQ